jgi:hypothetical protein
MGNKRCSPRCLPAFDPLVPDSLVLSWFPRPLGDTHALGRCDDGHLGHIAGSALACSRGMVSLDGVTMRLDDAYFPEEAETESAPVSARNATPGARMMSCRAEAA